MQENDFFFSKQSRQHANLLCVAKLKPLCQGICQCVGQGREVPAEQVKGQRVVIEHRQHLGTATLFAKDDTLDLEDAVSSAWLTRRAYWIEEDEHGEHFLLHRLPNLSAHGVPLAEYAPIRDDQHELQRICEDSKKSQ